MKLTEIRISLCGTPGSRLRAFCSLTFDQTFVVRDIKLIERNDTIFLAMPSRKLTDHCNRCGDKNHLRARYCNNCGARLNENRHAPHHNPGARLKLYADVAHPINAACRERGLRYSEFINGLNKAQIKLDRKSLSELAIHDPAAFDAIVEKARAAVA